MHNTLVKVMNTQEKLQESPNKQLAKKIASDLLNNELIDIQHIKDIKTQITEGTATSDDWIGWLKHEASTNEDTNE